MSKGPSPRSLVLIAALLCLVAVGAGVAFVRYSIGPKAAGEAPGSSSGCASERDSQLARTLARLSIITAVAFYETIAAQDGWKLGHFADNVNEDVTAVDPAEQGMGAFLCLTKRIGEKPAFMRLYFDDSS